MPNDHIPSPPAEPRSSEPIYVRLPPELLERVEAHRATLQASTPSGVEVSRAAAIRHLVELGLAGGGK